MREEVEKVFVDIRAILQADGSDIELVKVTDDGVVQVHFIGICGTCGGSMNTLRRGVEQMLMEQVSGVREVVAV